MQRIDGKKEFYQWDFGIKLTSEKLKINDKVHFSNITVKDAIPIDPEEIDGQVVVKVPNELLQYAFPLSVYHFIITEDGGYTKEEYTFNVIARPKPLDYIYTESEVTTLQGYIKEATKDLLKNPDETVAEEEWSEDGGEHLDMHVLVRNSDGSKVWQSVRKRVCDDGHLPVYYSGGNIMIAGNQDDIIAPDPDNPNMEYEWYGYNYALSIPAAKKHFARQTTKTVTERVDIEHDPITGIVKFIMSPALDESLKVSFEMYYVSDESEFQNGYSFTLPADVEVYEYPERFVGDEWYVAGLQVQADGWDGGERTVTYSVHDPDIVEVKKSLTVRGKKVLTEDDIPLGDIDTALDAILAIQASLIGGDA